MTSFVLLKEFISSVETLAVHCVKRDSNCSGRAHQPNLSGTTNSKPQEKILFTYSFPI